MKFSLACILVFSSTAFGFDQKVYDSCKGSNEPTALMSWYPEIPADVWSKSGDEIAQEFLKVYSADSFDAWMLLGQSLFRIRKAGYLIQEQTAQESLDYYWGIQSTVPEALMRIAQNPLHYTEASKKFTADQIKSYFSEKNYFDDEVSKSASLICLRYSAPGCAKAPRAAAGMMNSHIVRGSLVSAPELIGKIFTEEIYARAMIPVAQKIFTRAHLLTSENQTTNKDFSTLDELLTFEFKKLGLSDAEALDKTMDVMGLYATRGASVDALSQFATPENFQAFFALQIISAGLSLLEFEQPKTAANFALPRSIKSSCLYGNIYHFWMAAYLSYSLKKQGFKDRAAFSAVHILSVGYQMFALTVTRDPGDFLVSKVDSSFKQSLRSTVIIDDAGALWGIKRSQKEWNLDYRHRWMLSHHYRLYDYTKLSADEKNKIIKNKLHYYLLWTSEIRHNALFSEISGKSHQVVSEENLTDENENAVIDYRF